MEGGGEIDQRNAERCSVLEDDVGEPVARPGEGELACWAPSRTRRAMRSSASGQYRSGSDERSPVGDAIRANGNEAQTGAGDPLTGAVEAIAAVAPVYGETVQHEVPSGTRVGAKPIEAWRVRSDIAKREHQVLKRNSMTSPSLTT